MSGSTTIRYGKPTPPRFSRSRITRVISVVPPGTVSLERRVGEDERLRHAVLGRQRDRRVVGVGDRPRRLFPRTRSTASSAEPSS